MYKDFQGVDNNEKISFLFSPVHLGAAAESCRRNRLSRAEKKYKHERFNNAFVTYVPHDNFGGVSLGIFIFMNPDRPADRVHDTRMHEYGHTIQSLLLGPLWAFVIAIPSFIWCNVPKFVRMRKEDGVSYYKLYCEGWANIWGRAWSRENFISDEFKTTGYYGKPIAPIDFSKKK